jgi:putative endonuclease
MAKNHNYYVYILSNRHNSVLYTGVTNNLLRRVYEHKNGHNSSFTKKYQINKLVYLEHYDHIDAAIKREKVIKRFKRHQKNSLIEQTNPEWLDLFDTL